MVVFPAVTQDDMKLEVDKARWAEVINLDDSENNGRDGMLNSDQVLVKL